jgi:2-polyprenyl-3-methyl-5-hydroxy-6-metoxy-1,4-benzoquinol methylase
MAIERIIPGTLEWDAFYANHLQRYQFAAAELAAGKELRVLDAACGVGYGSKQLAGTPAVSEVTAIDRSTEALALARGQFAAPNIRYLEDDCHTLAAASASGPFDAVVSFETLEHLPNPEAFLQSCYRNLQSGGQLIISTPNKSVSSPDTLDWEYHEKEYTATEFLQLLKQAGFSEVRLFGQQYSLKGQLKRELRGDLNRLFSNPFVRAGAWMQRLLRGYKPAPVLRETLDDFEIRAFSTPAACEAMELNGPFVLLAVATRP